MRLLRVDVGEGNHITARLLDTQFSVRWPTAKTKYKAERRSKGADGFGHADDAGVLRFAQDENYIINN
jgi:hypothetical protein